MVFKGFFTFGIVGGVRYLLELKVLTLRLLKTEERKPVKEESCHKGQMNLVQ